ncbi:hypothetical protein K8S19_10500 [bacterium]|nr:hypothetical protein [bacterium]
MKFEERFFRKQKYTSEQVQQYYRNALKDLDIAEKDTFASVKFNYAYSAFLKAGIALLANHQVHTRSVPGHHMKIIEKMGEILKSKDVVTMGNLMRTKRNLDLYDGGIDPTRKECREYIDFTRKTIKKVIKHLTIE